MVQPNLDDGLFVMVELNYQGVFTRNHFSYLGGAKSSFNNVDFSFMNYAFPECFMHEEIKKTLLL